MKKIIVFIFCMTIQISIADEMPYRLGKDDILYFIMLDRFADGDPHNNMDVDLDNPLAFHGGDLVGLQNQLDELLDLGITMIWITPIHQQIEGAIATEDGMDFFAHHGYWANDFTKVDPRFGDEAQLKSLVEAAHAKGIKVILDVVYNHVGYGAQWETSKPEWLRMASQCGGSDTELCLAGLPDIRTELSAVQSYLFNAHISLAKRTGLDGFRLDTVKHIGHDFWQKHRDVIDRELGEDFLLLGEVWGADKFTAKTYFKANEMNGVFDFTFRDRTLEFLNGLTDGKRFARYLSKRHDIETPYFLSAFLSNHDMPTLLAMLRGDRSRYLLATTLLFSLEGMPTITWGEEIGRVGTPWPGNRANMVWKDDMIRPNDTWYRDESIREHFKTLIHLRKHTPALRSRPTKVLWQDKDAFALLRDESVLVVINRGGEMTQWPDEIMQYDDWSLVYSSQSYDNTIDKTHFIGKMEARIYQKL